MTRVRFAEKIMVWDEPHRWAFHLTESAVPLAHAMAEDYQVTAQGDHAVVQWTFAIDPSAGLKPAMPLAQPLLPRLFRRAMTNLSIRLGQNQSQR
jgi:hypothetical protein